jgi:hypothetical protein
MLAPPAAALVPPRNPVNGNGLDVCPCCNRPFPPKVKFGGPIRQKIFEFICRNPTGVTSRQVLDHVWANAPGGGPASAKAVWCHVAEINKKLKELGLLIRAPSGRGGEYTLRKLTDV